MNPLISTVHCADPSAHVWPESDRIWIYSSNDQPTTNTCDSMKSYHAFSSDDMVNWIDHGCIFHIKDVQWAAKQLWAPDATYYKGTYYLVFCTFEASTGIFRTGLATSSRPEGPFVDTGFIEGVRWGQDPALFIDEDGTPYLFCGAGHKIEGYQLQEDLRSVVSGTYVDLTPQLPWGFEGPWVHKYQGKYYLSYPGLYEKEWPEHMYYATAEHPLGPYTYKGEYIPVYEKQSGTNHGSIVEYKGKWYAFHHSMWVSGRSECRNIMCDYIEYEENGDIKPIVPTAEGVKSLKDGSTQGKTTILLDASVANLACGQLIGTTASTERLGYTGHGYVTNFKHIYCGVTVMAQSCVDRKAKLYIRYCAPTGDQNMKIMVNDVSLSPIGMTGYVYDKRISFPKADDWTDLYVGEIDLAVGDNYIELYNGTGNVDIDCFRIEEIG